MDKALTVLAWLVGIPIVGSSVMVWVGWRHGCDKEERLQREERENARD